MEPAAPESPGICNTGTFVEKLDAGHGGKPLLPELLWAGYDDVTVCFDLTGSRSLGRMAALPGRQVRSGKMLGEDGSFGVWAHLLGRSAAFWKADTSRLYVQAKLAPEGRLCAPEDFSLAYAGLLERMAVLGIVSYEPAWVSRVDVAVDCRCEPSVGKVLLDAIAAARLPNGWRITEAGKPRSTVYFRQRASESVLARSYCRNLKMRQGEAFGLIRCESEHRFKKPREMMVELLENPATAKVLWESRFGGLSSRVVRLSREAQTMKLVDKVKAGELGYAAAERMATFLDSERLGIAQDLYPPSVLAARRREARKLGLDVNDVGTDAVDLELGALLDPYASAFG